VDRHLDGYNPTDGGRRIQDFVDLLSNWYVRRSRRRFWRSEGDEDKISAYATLYTCLTSLCKLLAPFMPFVADEMYRNLVHSVDSSQPESVHLADFPQAVPDMIDQPLMDATRLAMRVSSMGRGARSKASVRVRQPLATVAVKPRTPEEREYLRQVQPQVLDELNIKELQVLDEDASLYRRAGQAAGEQTEAIVQVDSYWASLEGGYMVAVDTTITPELADEGLARELVHRIQNLRRSAKFEITDRIVTSYRGPDRVGEVMHKFADYIRQETLSDSLTEGEPGEEANSETQKLDGMEVTLGVRRAG
jgi:isoleucyl-tRNA synthetase